MYKVHPVTRQPSSSTRQRWQRRGKEMDDDLLIQKSSTLWPESYSPLWTKCFFFSSFSCFLFSSFSHLFQLGKHQSLVCGTPPYTSFAQGQGANVAQICLHRGCSKKRCVSLPNNAFAPKLRNAMLKVHVRWRCMYAEGACMFCLPWWQQTQKCRRSFPCKIFGWSSSSTWQRQSLVFEKKKKTNVPTRLQTTSSAQSKAPPRSACYTIFLWSTPGRKSQRSMTKQGNVFLKRKRSRRRPLFLKTKCRFYQALFPTVVDPVAMRAWVRGL